MNHPLEKVKLVGTILAIQLYAIGCGGFPTLGTKPFNFHRSPRCRKAATGRGGGNRFRHGMIGNLARHAATPADQELMWMFMRVIVIMCVPIKRLSAAHKGVQPFQPMDQALFQQKIQRAVNGGRCRAGPACLQLIKQRIGSNRGLSLQHQAQHVAAQRCELNATPLAKHLSPFERGQIMSRTMHKAF